MELQIQRLLYLCYSWSFNCWRFTS